MEGGIHAKLVEKLPLGIHSPLGERGRGLSEGQAQRISIARAILRNSPILMLDEATSALDADTEQQLLSNLFRDYPNKTCIVTSHRTSILHLCQRVYHIKNRHLTQLSDEEIKEMYSS